MTFYATDPQTGLSIGPLSDTLLPTYQAEGVWTISSAPSSTGVTINPLLPQAQTQFTNDLALGNLNNSTTNSEATMLGAQGGYLTGLANSYEQFRGPSNWAQYANLMRGQTSGNLPAFISALEGLTPLNNAYVDPTQLQPQSFTNDTAGVLPTATTNTTSTSGGTSQPAATTNAASQSQASTAGGGAPSGHTAVSSDSKISWKRDRAAAGIRADDSNPYTDKQFKQQGTPSQVDYSRVGLPANDPANNPNYMTADDNHNNPQPYWGAQNAPAPAAAPPMATPYQQAQQTVQQGNTGSKDRNQNQDSRATDQSLQSASQSAGNSLSQGASDVNGSGSTQQAAQSSANALSQGASDVIHAAAGTTHVVHRPTTIHVGEHGRPELVVVHPLDNPGVPISPQTAQQANTVDPHMHVQPRPATGPIPIWARRLGPGHLASGGDMVYGGSLYGDGQTTITSSHPSPISDTGQVTTQQGSTVPINEATPYIQPYQVRSSAYRKLTPLELQLYNSNLAAQGEDPQTYWARYQQGLPFMQQVPSSTRLVQTQAA